MICPICQHNQNDGIPTCQKCNFNLQQGYPQQQAQPNQFYQQGQPNQYNPQGQPNQFAQQAQPNQYNPPAQPNQFYQQAQPNQFNPQAQYNQYNPPAQPNQFAQQAQPNQFNPQGQPNQYNPQGQPNQYNPQAQPNQFQPQAQPNQFNQQAQPNQFNQQAHKLNSDAIESIIHLVGKNQSYYREAFRKVEAGENSFNWCAFCFTTLLHLYHKMYKLPTILFFLSLILYITNTSILSIEVDINLIFNIFILIFSFVNGRNFNKIYYHYLLEVVDKKRYLHGSEYCVFEEQNGGVSAMNVWIYFVPIVNCFIPIVHSIKGIKQFKTLDYNVKELFF